MPQNTPDYLTTLYPPCYYCTHLTKVGTQYPDLTGWTCPAFPNGIKYNILMGRWDHTTPIMSQVGDTVFEGVIEEHDGVLEQATFSRDWLPVE